MAKTTWKQYFSVIKIIPGPVIVPGRGLIDFSNPNIPIQTIQELYENDCPYLRITPQGFDALYGNSPDVASPTPIPHPKSLIPNPQSPIEDDQSSIVNRKSSIDSPFSPLSHFSDTLKLSTPSRKPKIINRKSSIQNKNDFSSL